MRDIMNALRGIWKMLNFSLFDNDKREDGWTLLSDSPHSAKFKPTRMEDLSPDTITQARKLGQHEAEYLVNNQDLIPKCDGNDIIFIFPGTVWKSENGMRMVPALTREIEYVSPWRITFIPYFRTINETGELPVKRKVLF
jgi:hypothetical protein